MVGHYCEEPSGEVPDVFVREFAVQQFRYGVAAVLVGVLPFFLGPSPPVAVPLGHVLGEWKVVLYERLPCFPGLRRTVLMFEVLEEFSV